MTIRDHYVALFAAYKFRFGLALTPRQRDVLYRACCEDADLRPWAVALLESREQEQR